MTKETLRTATRLGLPMTHPATGLPTAVKIYEVGARDGLQAERAIVPGSVKVQLIRDLAAAGLPMVEATSFVSPKWIPQLADAAEVLGALRDTLGADLGRYPVLVPNQKGLDRAISAGAETIAVFVSATDTFAAQNLNMTRTQALEVARDVVAAARAAGLRARGYVSMCFGDPWEGPVEPMQVVQMTAGLVDAGCYEVSLGDTIGVGTPGHVTAMVGVHVAAGIGPDRLALHFHDTYGQALANVYAGLQCGVTTFDAAAGGIGGCPYAGSASGNLATEDLLWMLQGLGIATGVDLEAVRRAGSRVTAYLGRPSPSRVVQALSRG